jgi:hypothetical protein
MLTLQITKEQVFDLIALVAELSWLWIISFLLLS